MLLYYLSHNYEKKLILHCDIRKILGTNKRMKGNDMFASLLTNINNLQLTDDFHESIQICNWCRTAEG